MANVVFRTGTKEQYEALTKTYANTLYWLTDAQELWKGDILFAKGAEATATAAGLMSATDKARLDALVSTTALGIDAADASIIIGDISDGKSVAVQISAAEGNGLVLKDDGLYSSGGGGGTATLEWQDM